MRYRHSFEWVFTKTPTYSTVLVSYTGVKISECLLKEIGQYIVNNSTIFWTSGEDSGLDPHRNMQTLRTHCLIQNSRLSDHFDKFTALEFSDTVEPCVAYYIRFSC